MQDRLLTLEQALKRLGVIEGILRRNHGRLRGLAQTGCLRDHDIAGYDTLRSQLRRLWKVIDGKIKGRGISSIVAENMAPGAPRAKAIDEGDVPEIDSRTIAIVKDFFPQWHAFFIEKAEAVFDEDGLAARAVALQLIENEEPSENLVEMFITGDFDELSYKTLSAAAMYDVFMQARERLEKTGHEEQDESGIVEKIKCVAFAGLLGYLEGWREIEKIINGGFRHV